MHPRKEVSSFIEPKIWEQSVQMNLTLGVRNQSRRRERKSSHLLAILGYSKHGKGVRLKNSICSITCINGFVKLSEFEKQDHSGSNEIYATGWKMV